MPIIAPTFDASITFKHTCTRLDMCAYISPTSLNQLDHSDTGGNSGLAVRIISPTLGIAIGFYSACIIATSADARNCSKICRNGALTKVILSPALGCPIGFDCAVVGTPNTNPLPSHCACRVGRSWSRCWSYIHIFWCRLRISRTSSL